MYKVSSRFIDAIKNSHTIVTQVEALDPFNNVREEIEITDATFTQSWSDAVHRSGKCSLVDPLNTMIPLDASHILSPFTTRLRGWSGIKFSDGTTELVPQGVYKIGDFDANEKTSGSAAGGAKSIDLDLMDFSSQCQQPLDVAIGINGGTPLLSAIVALLTSAVPTMIFRMTGSTTFTVPGMLIREDQDVWVEATALAQAAGFDLLMDRDGACGLVPRFGVAAQNYVWDFIEGPKAVFWNPGRKISADLYPNVVVVVGTNSQAPNVRAEAADMDPTSATYVYGPYGRVVKTVKSTRVVSNAQAQQAANGILTRLLGIAETATFSCLPNPALDIGDTVSITRETMGLDHQLMLVTKIDHPGRAANEMVVTTQRSVFTDEETALSITGALTGIIAATAAGTPAAA